MSIKKIIVYGNPHLRDIARGVSNVNNDSHIIVADMRETLKYAQGLAIAAPQIDVPLRIVVISPEFAKQFKIPEVWINPEITVGGGRVLDEEGCLSIPGIYQKVPRAKTVNVKAINLKEKPIELELNDFSARVVQHEVDHLDGILFTDRLGLLRKIFLGPRLKKIAKNSKPL